MAGDRARRARSRDALRGRPAAARRPERARRGGPRDADRGVHPSSPLVIATERAVFGEGEDDLGGLLHPPTTLAAPLRGREGLRGVLVADNRFTELAPDPIARLVFTLVADHAGRALHAAERFAELSREARTDALTGLDSRRVGLTLLEHAASGALASGAPVALVLLDLDRFKQVNDRHGHPAGDAVLREVGARLRGALERGARAFRYGGEEIGIVLEGHAPAEAVALAERVRAAIAAAPIAAGEVSLTLTTSVGVACAPPHPADARTLLHRADAALLTAKRTGRDRVVVA